MAVTGHPSTAVLHTVVACSKAGPLGSRVYSRRDEFSLTAPAMCVLRLPVASPESCGVTAIGIGNSLLRRVGDRVVARRITVEILAPCTVQSDGTCV